MKNNYYYFKMCVMMFAFFLMQATVANTRLRAVASAETPSRTYEFYKGSTDLSANLVQKQIILSGEKLLLPELPQDASGAFIGWFEAGATKAFSFAEAITFSDSKTVKLQAKFSDKVYVHFIVKSINEEAGLKVATTKEVKKGEAVNVDDIPIIYPDGKKLTHWTLTPDTDGNGPTYDFATGVTENISLYAVYEPAWRVYFRMRGGKSILPKYYSNNDPLNPSGEIVPDRAGYIFNEWFLKEKPEDDTPDDSSAPNFYNTSAVTKNLELYALWNKGTAAYKVAHWQQNADDNEYSFVEIEEKSGTTESEAVYVPKDYPGFNLNGVKTDKEPKSKIDGFGTTVKHVFYDRKTYTLSFKKGEQKPEKFENVKFGAKTDTYWQQIVEKYPNHTFSKKQASSNTTIYYTHPPRMPNGNFKLNVQPMGGENFKVYYYEQATEPLKEVLSPFEFKHTNLKLYLEPKGFASAEGFTQEVYDGNDHEKNQFTLNNSGVRVGKRFFTRNKYKITFLKKKKDDLDKVVEGILFEEKLDNKALTDFTKGVTTREDNFIFGGWFTAEETQDGAEEFVFEGKTMPAHDIILYAKWLKPTYKVYFHPNNDKNSVPYAVLEYEHNTVIPETDAFEKVSALTDSDVFFKWFWYPSLGRYVRYDFGMPITQDVHLYPTWKHKGFKLTYDLGGGTGSVPVDENIYFVAKDAIVKATDGLQAPEGKFFIGWKPRLAVRNKRSLNNKLYAPGEKIAVVDNLILTAQWGELPKRTNITYKPNGGAGVDITEELMNNETHVTKAKETFILAGNEIISWNTQSDGGGKTFALGVSVIVNNKSETPNVLYAQWGKTTGVNTVASNLRINYYPNPVLTTLNIEGEQIISRVEILDALGKFVQVIDGANSKHLRSDLSNLSPGLYYVKVFSNNEKTVFKVIKK